LHLQPMRQQKMMTLTSPTHSVAGACKKGNVGC
jgi:hypothetical protein